MKDFLEGLALIAGFLALLAALTVCVIHEVGPCLFLLGLR